MSCERTPARFEAVLAPDDRWMIFDLNYGWPAEMDGQVLIGLDRRVALDLERRLNWVEAYLTELSRSASSAGGGPNRTR